MTTGVDGAPAPWRRARPAHPIGMPAWSLPSPDYASQSVPSSLFDAVDCGWAWDGSAGDGVRVCVLDSGITGSHPMVGPVDRAWEVVVDDRRVPAVVPCEPRDLVGHGTACASIIRTVAPGVSLSSVKVLGDGPSGNAPALAAGLSFAIDQGFDVVNMSVSTVRPEFRAKLTELCDRAYFRRTTLVVAAHNLPVPSFPWNFASVISVASHAETDPLRIYYNATPPVEFFARGVRVPVAGLNDDVVTKTGNSFAAPHVAGIAARVLGKHPWLTPFQLKSALYHCAANVAQPWDRNEVDDD